LLKAVEETIGESLNVAWERDTTRRLSDRIAYITEKIQSGGPIPAFSNGRPKWAEAVSLTWLTWPDGPGRQRRLRFVLTIPITIADRHGEELIQVLGIRAQAWWGYLATPGLGVLALQQTRRPWGEPIPPKGLPVLCGEEEMDVIVRPHQFGWLNYWSEEAAGLQGIAASGVRNGVEVRKLDSGGWLIKLTDEPLDPDRADHFARLAGAYESFPGVGRVPRPRA